MKILFLLIKTSFGLFLTATITSILTGLCSTRLVGLIHEAIQNEIQDSTAYFAQFVIFIVLYGVFALIAAYSISTLTQSAVHHLRLTLSRKILSANFQKMEHDSSKILPVLTTDIYTFSYAIDQLPHVLTGVATIIGLYGYLFWLSWKLMLLMFSILIFVYPLMKFTMPLLVKYSDSARTIWATVYSYLDGLVNGLKELTLNKNLRTTYVEDLIAPLSLKQNKYNIKENLAMALSTKLTEMILFSGIGFLMFLIMKTSIVEFDFFGEFLMILLFTLAPMSTASGFLQSIKRSEVALQKINELGLKLDDNVKPPMTELLTDKWTENEPLIELKSVSHQYYHQEEDRHFTLGPIDLSIYSKEIIFVVGGNGSGKTTFAKILTGLYMPKEGELLYKGTKITWPVIDNFRDRFAGLFTDFYLFDSMEHLPEEAIKERADALMQLLLLDKKVKIEDRKLSTVKLSQGQRKRLALMTAIIEDKEIYLFDEWAANQDPQFKSIFYNEILPDLKQQGKTCIVISHDDSYFGVGDRVLKIRDGQLVEERQLTDSNVSL